MKKNEVFTQDRCRSDAAHDTYWALTNIVNFIEANTRKVDGSAFYTIPENLYYDAKRALRKATGDFEIESGV